MPHINLRDIFILVDESEGGLIGIAEFRHAVQLIGRGDLSLEQSRHLLRGCFHQGSDRISFNGFCRAIQALERERTPLLRAQKANSREHPGTNPDTVVHIDEYRKRKLLGYLLTKHPFMMEKLQDMAPGNSEGPMTPSSPVTSAAHVHGQGMRPATSQFPSRPMTSATAASRPLTSQTARQPAASAADAGHRSASWAHPQLCAYEHCSLNYDFLEYKLKRPSRQGTPGTPSISWEEMCSRHIPAPPSSRRQRVSERLQAAGFGKLMDYTAGPRSSREGGHGGLYYEQEHPPPGPFVTAHVYTEEAYEAGGLTSPSGGGPPASASASARGDGARWWEQPGHFAPAEREPDASAFRPFTAPAPQALSGPSTPFGRPPATSLSVSYRPATSMTQSAMPMTPFREADTAGRARRSSVASCEGNYWNWGYAPLDAKASRTRSVYELPVQSPWRLNKIWNRGGGTGGWDNSKCPWRQKRYWGKGVGLEQANIHNMAVALIKTAGTIPMPYG